MLPEVVLTIGKTGAKLYLEEKIGSNWRYEMYGPRAVGII